jgi:hypothetical protein
LRVLDSILIVKKLFYGYKSVRAALLKYRDLNGNMLVPRKFVVPADDTWPKEMWNVKMGTIVNNIRAGSSCSKNRVDLESIGFAFNPQVQLYRYETIRAALLKYKDLKGDMLVPQKFVVAADDTWPKEMSGMKLGTIAMIIRRGDSYLKKRADLESIGFDFNPQRQKFRYEAIRAALLMYKDLSVNMLVPYGFVVPADDAWPKEMWDIKLGTIVNNIRAGSSCSKKRLDLESIGFDFNPQVYRYETIRAALLKYMDLNGDMLVLYRFVVPADEITWPKEMWGMKLGRVAISIRRGDSWSKKRADLESIGFDFNPQVQSYRYETIRAALLKYKDLEGDMLVPQKFVVPANDTWPKEIWSMKLGTIAMIIRRGDSCSKKRADLESIGFDFNPQI